MTEEVQTFESDFQPDKEFVISSLETLKVASDPVRLHILECLVEKPSTVKEIAQRLGSPATKLYYHVNLLEEHGLVKVVSQRVVSGIIEKQYRTRAYSYTVDKALLSLDAGKMPESVDSLLSVLFDATRDDVRRAIEQGLMNPAEEDPLKRNGFFFRSLTRLAPEQIKALQERLMEILKEFGSVEEIEAREKRGDALKPYGFTVALFPYPDEMHNRSTTID